MGGQTELYQVPAGRHATDIFLAESSTPSIFLNSQQSMSYLAKHPLSQFSTFSSKWGGSAPCTRNKQIGGQPLSSAHHMRHCSKLYSWGCIHEWIRVPFGTQTLELRMIKGPGEKCWPIFLFWGLQTIIWGQTLGIVRNWPTLISRMIERLLINFCSMDQSYMLEGRCEADYQALLMLRPAPGRQWISGGDAPTGGDD